MFLLTGPFNGACATCQPIRAVTAIPRLTDTTHVGDSGGSHYDEDEFPFCIVNDLPEDVAVLPFPVPA